ncbi:DUF3068 domain-containing protein [Actinocorallia sp. A-T 12471]|uniref:DUF3068 domain-containing protein n=1 Tax=Actinocorallia sp. A-T 12471 TaxID=3089813 RepID=UPI0029D2582F|nr:DUF3068 domain-containing protein [Actinocorallia sp. A-T 12471]MDX6743815.1 DUF3068 domain-containing protein [Actinocorallia sp. A-T 12471]
MRRGGFLLVMLGAFFLTLAPLTRFYIADKVVAAPLDFQERITLVAPDGAYYDMVTNKVKRGQEIKGQFSVSGDVRNGTDELLALIGTFYLSQKDGQLSLIEFQFSPDRRTGLLTNEAGAMLDRDASIRQSGYGLMLPIGNVEQRTYQVFDLPTGRTWPAVFSGVETIEGVTAYRFEQKVEPTLVGKSKKKVDPTVVGLPKKADPVKIDRYYASENTFWVDPRTGMPIKLRQNVDSTLRAADGHEGTFVKADLVTRDEDVKKLAERSEAYAGNISLVRVTLPAVAFGVGLVMLIVGGVLTLVAKPRQPKAAK